MDVPKAPKLGTLPGVNYMTDRVGSANVGPMGLWRKRACRLIGAMNNAKAYGEFRPFLAEAECWLEAAMTQLAAAAGGTCGPIEANALATAAWQTAYARYWMHKAAADPSDTRLFEIASRVADSARANSLAAYDIAVRLHRHAPPNGDPLAFIDEQDRQLPPPTPPKVRAKKVVPEVVPEPTPSNASLENE